MKTNNKNYITCPYCGTEYMPCEIFIPNSFINQTRDIEKDHMTGKIMYTPKDALETKEEYKCDRCNSTFKIEAKVSFFTDKLSNVDFNTDYTMNLSKNRLFLKEE